VQWRPGDNGSPSYNRIQQNKDGAKPKNREPHDQKCYKCAKWGHISYQCQGEKGDKKEKDSKEKKKQENSNNEKESEDKPRSKDLISTLALSSISRLERERISLTQAPQTI
jgi:hypothetical protein